MDGSIKKLVKFYQIIFMNPINTGIFFWNERMGLSCTILTTNPRFNFYGVWERTKNLAQEKYPGVKTFEHWRKCWLIKILNWLLLIHPASLTLSFAMEAILGGKHLIVEKPFTATVLQAEELIAAAKKKGVKLSVYHNRRYDSDYRTIKKVLEVKDRLVKLLKQEIHYDRYVPELSYKIHKETPHRCWCSV
jgi:hypothetical protein